MDYLNVAIKFQPLEYLLMYIEELLKLEVYYILVKKILKIIFEYIKNVMSNNNYKIKKIEYIKN